MPVVELKDNKKFVKAYVNNFNALIKKEIVSFFIKIAEEGYRKAIHEAGYVNRTGNLQSSIGAIVAENGKEIYRVGFNKILEGDKGVDKGILLAKKYIPKSGIGVVFVAGEHYSFFVENLYGYNVIASTELYMKNEFKNFLTKLRNDNIRVTQ